MPDKTKCHLWTQEVITDADITDALDFVESYSEDDHLNHRLMRCNKCGQLYLKEFYEETSWADSEDPQYVTWLPVDSAEEAKKIHQAHPLGLPKDLPQLKSDWPNDAEKKIYWLR